ncbi:MAG TPA: helix-turn-helix transcriptional regulator [Oscillospiraceae bacterium]|nr:helix-turn-helix transcriptional regulator [Oscillospiraceae bacterium]
MLDRARFKYHCMKANVSLEAVAHHINVNPATLTRKMNGQSDFTRTEIVKIRDYLNLSVEDAEAVFLVKNLHKRK